MARFAVDHVHLRSLDPERAADFYVEMFGAEVVGRMQNGAALRVVLDLDGLRLFIEQVPPGTASTPASPFLGVEHIGLAVQDLDAAAAELRRKGAEFAVEPNSPRPGFKLAFVKAPDGVRVEILQRDAA
jgi:catechol 2,3-dioxygenase-like lactoylglutathione lyase family enzyme